MPLNLKVSYADALSSFGGRDVRALIQSVSAGHDQTTGLPMKRENIEITPAPTQASARRTITWHMAMIVAESDEDDYEEFSEIVGQILGAAGGLSTMIAGLEAGLPPNPLGAVNLIVKTMQGIDKVLEKKVASKTIKVAPLKVEFEGRDGKQVSLSARWFIDATWASDEADDDNKAWIETEALLIGKVADIRSTPNDWDAEDWDPTTGAPRGHMGRAFMEPHGQQDVTGAFKTEPGGRPRRALIEGTGSPINDDETFIDVSSSVNAMADDTVIVVVNRVILELEATVIEREEEPKGEPKSEGDGKSEGDSEAEGKGKADDDKKDAKLNGNEKEERAENDSASAVSDNPESDKKLTEKELKKKLKNANKALKEAEAQLTTIKAGMKVKD